MRKIRYFLALCLGIGCILLTGSAGWVLSSLPHGSQSFSVSGISNDIQISVDGRGIPHLEARNIEDAGFALGFIHARDRLWQMDAMRRSGAGRLSEIVGSRALPVDRQMRKLGLMRRVTEMADALPADVKRHLEAYAKGVNFWINQNQDALPLEFILLGYRPEPWQVTDTLLWGKLMAYRFARTYVDEFLRLRLSRKLTPAQIAQLWPGYPEDGPLIIPDHKRRADAADAVTDQLFTELSEGIADPRGMSNSWVLSGARTESGAPLLANDPHLRYRAPILWYLVRIELPDREIVGVTAPGVPYVVLGHNGHVAWGFTATQSDQADVFVERSPDGARRTYGAYGGYEAFESRSEEIRIKGQRPAKMPVAESRNGPMLSDVNTPHLQHSPREQDRLSFSLKAVFLEPGDTSPEALYRLNLAKNAGQFLKAASLLTSPQQNISYATIDGDIGYIAAGKIPIRKKGDGFIAGQAWSGDYDWTGYVPVEELPKLVNPSSGKIVTANNRVIGPDYPYPMGRHWSPPYRAQRIEDLLAQKTKHDVVSSAAIQQDVVSAMAADILPLMLKGVSVTAETKSALEVLNAWDFSADKDQQAPMLFYAWLREFNRLIYKDELANELQSYWSYRPTFVKSVLQFHHAWCDDVMTTEKQETCDELLSKSLITAIAEAQGRNWGEAHMAEMAHPLFHNIPGFTALADFTSPNSGGDYTVKRAATQPSSRSPYKEFHGGGFRGIYDLSNLSNSRFVIGTGQSGNILSGNYGDFFPLWRDGKYVTIGRIKSSSGISYSFSAAP